MLVIDEALQAARLLQRFQHRSDLITSITQDTHRHFKAS